MKVKIGDFAVTGEIRTNVQNVLNSGKLSPGPTVAAFERLFAQTIGVEHAIMTNSGTSALVVAIQAFKELGGWADGAEVIVPAITFVATVNAVLHNNLTPVLADVDPVSYTIDPAQVKEKITSNTVALLPVHVFGLPASMRPLMDLSSDNNFLVVIEDACEALGATYDGYMVGSIGDVACFSFYMSHHIAAGVGGMITTSEAALARKMRSLVNHGWEREAMTPAGEYDFEQIRKRYHFSSVGHSFRATEFEAALAIPQLAGLGDNLKQRLQNAKTLSYGLAKYAKHLSLPKTPHNRSHALMMYPIILKQGDKWDLIDHLERGGIETREMLPLTNQPCYAGLWNEDDYPIAKWINEQGFYVGCSQYLDDRHMKYIIEKVAEYFG